MSGPEPGEPGAQVVADALAAIARKDWEELRSMLHPYLHWAEGAQRLRGRTRVMKRLAEGPKPLPPSRWELREGQIYRWEE